MIALDRELPENCLCCPCYGHIHVTSGTLEEDTLVKVCMPLSRVMDSMKWKKGDPTPQDEWYNFKKPEWCPWIEIKEESK